ncbi:hypothetical protein GE061_002370 [Apolygus lucorum]|uniref:Uncharacterized protein n=1 Tax=Apolygus lucorum TaxID=248454 RepID=A0A8S9X4J9_APOLU|nr:hypothetical protein GE061_002370 [Apolygus lucorum]
MNARIASLGQAVRVLAALLLLALSSAADLSVASTLEDGQRVLYYLTGTVAGKETPLTGYAMAVSVLIKLPG